MANQSNGMEIVPMAGGSVRQDFGGVESTALAETASTAVAAQARAAVESRYILALRRPRDWDDVRVRLLKECARPGFAALAIYRKPIGAGVEGPSIRFAEAALRCMTNVFPEVAVVYDDAGKRIVRVSVTDLESNLTYSQDLVVEKTVERASVKGGQTAISQRTNSYGKTTFLVAATEDDLLMKQGALVSKALRTLALRILPGDLLDDAVRKVWETRNAENARDPEAARKALADAFAPLGVMPSDLKTYLGHELGSAGPAEIEELRSLFAAIREGETTWSDAVEAKGAAKPAAAPATNGTAKGAAGAKAKLAAVAGPKVMPGSKTGSTIEIEPDPHAPPDDAPGFEPGGDG